MPTNKSKENQETNEKQIGHYHLSRRILLATIGAAALAQDEINEFINRLVERGEIAEKEGGKLREEIREKREKYKQEIQNRREKWHSPIVTKAEIESLEAKIKELEKKISELK